MPLFTNSLTFVCYIAGTSSQVSVVTVGTTSPGRAPSIIIRDSQGESVKSLAALLDEFEELDKSQQATSTSQPSSKPSTAGSVERTVLNQTASQPANSHLAQARDVLANTLDKMSVDRVSLIESASLPASSHLTNSSDEIDKTLQLRTASGSCESSQPSIEQTLAELKQSVMRSCPSEQENSPELCETNSSQLPPTAEKLNSPAKQPQNVTVIDKEQKCMTVRSESNSSVDSLPDLKPVSSIQPTSAPQASISSTQTVKSSTSTSTTNSDLITVASSAATHVTSVQVCI